MQNINKLNNNKPGSFGAQVCASKSDFKMSEVSFGKILLRQRAFINFNLQSFGFDTMAFSNSFCAASNNLICVVLFCFVLFCFFFVLFFCWNK